MPSAKLWRAICLGWGLACGAELAVHAAPPGAYELEDTNPSRASEANNQIRLAQITPVSDSQLQPTDSGLAETGYPSLVPPSGNNPLPVPDEGPWSNDTGLPIPGGYLPAPVGGYFRMEALNWKLQSPGKRLLGAPVAGVDAFSSFAGLDEIGDPVTITIPNTSGVNFDDVLGLRLSSGWDFQSGGTLETTNFITENAVKRQGVSGIPSGNAVATSVLINGEISDTNNLFLYNSDYSASYASRVWGSELNYFFAPRDFDVLDVRPMVGVRWISLYEKIRQEGTFVSGTETVDTLIEQWAHNYLVGPQVGLRLQLPTKYFTFGVDPKAGIGASIANGKVHSVHLRGSTDGEYSNSKDSTICTPFLDVNGYVRWHPTDYLSFTLGYSYTYISQMLRAVDAVYWNDTGDLGQPPGLRGATTRQDFFMRGLSVGAELRW